MTRNISCAFTGHREDKLNLNEKEWQKLRDLIIGAIEELYAEGITHFICGMARGSDLCFGECVLKCKNELHTEITLEAAIPFAGQADKWPSAEKARYDYILSECEKITVLQDRYTRWCMMERNKYMIDNAVALIAVYNGSAGGTQNTMLYAIRQGIQILEIDAT